ncbi:MAG: hypothetical protein KA817_08095, partial [Flavobacteriales bacterium]|nr:hypothetical protein [Flavobacteriales bacterium]
LARTAGAALVRPAHEHQLHFADGDLTLEPVDVGHLVPEQPLVYLEALAREYPYDAERVIDYLKSSGYRGDRILYLIPTDDAFQPTHYPVIRSDFKRNVHERVTLADIVPEQADMSVLQLRIRREVLMCVVENQLPWEDFSIGFQMRVLRAPNTYESDLWYHFTNVYIAGHHFRYSSFCGACTVVEQNPIWASRRV